MRRSVRAHGDTKTRKSKRTLALPRAGGGGVEGATLQQAADRLAAGELWQDTDLVFTTTVSTRLDAANLRHTFQKLVRDSGGCVNPSWPQCDGVDSRAIVAMRLL